MSLCWNYGRHLITAATVVWSFAGATPAMAGLASAILAQMDDIEQSNLVVYQPK